MYLDFSTRFFRVIALSNLALSNLPSFPVRHRTHLIEVYTVVEQATGTASCVIHSARKLPRRARWIPLLPPPFTLPEADHCLRIHSTISLEGESACARTTFPFLQCYVPLPISPGSTSINHPLRQPSSRKTRPTSDIARRCRTPRPCHLRSGREDVQP